MVPLLKLRLTVLGRRGGGGVRGTEGQNWGVGMGVAPGHGAASTPSFCSPGPVCRPPHRAGIPGAGGPVPHPCCSSGPGCPPALCQSSQTSTCPPPYCRPRAMCFHLCQSPQMRVSSPTMPEPPDQGVVSLFSPPTNAGARVCVPHYAAAPDQGVPPAPYQMRVFPCTVPEPPDQGVSPGHVRVLSPVRVPHCAAAPNQGVPHARGPGPWCPPHHTRVPGPVCHCPLHAGAPQPGCVSPLCCSPTRLCVPPMPETPG